MKKVEKYKFYGKNILLVIVFALLTISIVKDIAEIRAVSSMNQAKCVPIIMYHQVKNNKLGKDVISPSEFESDLKYLADNNYTTITMTQLINYVYEKDELPENPIILSFDDGYLNTYKYVYPLLKEYDMKIVLSVVGKSIDDFSKVDETNIDYAHITWEQVKEMQESGLVEFQNHTYNSHKINCGRYGCSQMDGETLARYQEILFEDVITLQEKIKSEINVTPNTFTYPYGKYNDNTDKILKKAGFKATLSCKFGVNLIRRDKPENLFGLKRICRSHNQSIEKMIKEGIETLKYADE